jgi:hypothetical protein
MKAFGWTILILALATLPTRGEEPGQTPRPATADPVREPTDEELVRLDKTLPEWLSVKDDAPYVYAGKREMDAVRVRKMLDEERAFNYVLSFAHRQPAERLRKYSFKGVPLENLFRDVLRDEYLRELIHMEGRLSLILPMKPTDDLRDLTGIERLYEAWVVPPGSDKLVCVVVSELPEGVQPGENQNVRVAFDAYYFKLWHYETRKVKDPAKDPDRHEWRRAPLFLGKTFQVTGPAVTDEPTYTPAVLYGLVGGLAALGLAGLGITLWFRRGDRNIRAAARQKIESGVMFENDQAAGPVNRIADQF